MSKKNPVLPELLSVVIPVYNALDHLKNCLSSLKRAAAGRPLEIVLVDNASQPPVRRFIKSYKGAKTILLDRNYGFARAVNEGIKASGGGIVAVVNSDVIFFDGALARLTDCLAGHAEIGAVGPMTNRTVGSQRVVLAPEIEADVKALQRFAGVMQMRFAGEFFYLHRLVGFCFLLKREVIERVGLLDERFGTGCFEDFDYSLRIRQAGWQLAAAKDVFVRHHHHASFRNRDHFYACASANRGIFIDKWCRKSLEFLDELNPYLEIPAETLIKRPRARVKARACAK